MITRLLVASTLLVGALTFLATDEAQAGPRIYVGVGVSVPLGQRHDRRVVRRVRARQHVEYVGGYYETRTRQIRVPGRQIGWDLHGHAIYGRDRVEVREYQVWVPRRRIVRRVRTRYHGHRRQQGFGQITVGGRVRVR